MTASLNDRLRSMPSSLNDACRTMEEAAERIAELEGLTIGTAASLAATISLLERTPKAKMAAPSNTMFEQMMTDYRNSLEAARAALNPKAGS